MSRSSGLGRGLSALIPITNQEDVVEVERRVEGIDAGVFNADPPEDVEDAQLMMIPISAIRRNPLQPRTVFNDESLSDLADSIKEVGVLQPVLLRRIEGGYELVAGERRWLAAKSAELTMIPALVRYLGDRDSLEQAIVENLHREDLNPLEEAAAYRRLIAEFGMTQHDVARKVGRSRSAVANALRLLDLPQEVHELIDTGEISAGHGRSLAGLTDHEIQKTLARRIVVENLSVRQTESLIRSLDEDEQAVSTREIKLERSRDAMVLEVESILARQFATTVRVVSRGRRGRLVLEFADREDLQRIFNLLTS